MGIDDEILSHAKQEWPVVKRAPIALICVCVIAFVLAYVASRWRYVGIIETLNAHVAQLSDLNTEYKEKLEGKTPDQAAKEISDLRSQVTDLNNEISIIKEHQKHRHLSEEQIKTIAHEAKEFCSESKKIYFDVSFADPEAIRYAEDFRNAFTLAGCIPVVQKGLRGEQSIGLTLGVVEGIHVDSRIKEFEKIISTANLKIEHKPVPSNYIDGANDFIVIVGSKSES